MRIFLDECVDWRLSRDIVGHQVMTARQMGWTSIENGELLALAAQEFDVFVQEFDVFVTVDRNLSSSTEPRCAGHSSHGASGTDQSVGRFEKTCSRAFGRYRFGQPRTGDNPGDSVARVSTPGFA